MLHSWGKDKYVEDEKKIDEDKKECRSINNSYIERKYKNLQKPNLFPATAKLADMMEKPNLFPATTKLTNIMKKSNFNLPDYGLFKSSKEMDKAFKSYFKKMSVPDFKNMQSISATLADFNFDISNIEWTNFKITDDVIEDSNAILESENPGKIISEEIKQSDQHKGIKDSVKSILLFLYYFFEMLNSIVNVAEYTEDKVIPAVQSVSEYVQEGFFNSENEAMKWLNDELKDGASEEITQNFRIVTKNELIVREGKKVDSRINGKLNSTDVVQIVEKRKNWTYIFHSNYEDSEVTEGWVFTRYLKKIK